MYYELYLTLRTFPSEARSWIVQNGKILIINKHGSSSITISLFIIWSVLFDQVI
jgi:hypothetical protein